MIAFDSVTGNSKLVIQRWLEKIVCVWTTEGKGRDKWICYSYWKVNPECHKQLEHVRIMCPSLIDCKVEVEE